MAEISDISHATALDIKDDNVHHILSCPCLASKKLGDETISFTQKVPAYILAQVMGATLATVTVRLMFKEEQLQFLRTIPAGSDLQSLGLEFLITFYLMFAVAGTVMDNRAVGELTGHVIGAVITINSILAGPISGASMNPARSLGPAILSNCYKKQWIYILGPTAGAIAGIWFYNAMKPVKPYIEVTKFLPFLRRLTQNKV
ncbi:hypothetical protein KY289_014429 [Solanum tuberosum]|nr:hypothetical protein KY289_014429 [Solanum tuberosum]KAH0699560.1 hypothetical protein KY284_013775 [Solanum tuberosum]